MGDDFFKDFLALLAILLAALLAVYLVTDMLLSFAKDVLMRP